MFRARRIMCRRTLARTAVLAGAAYHAVGRGTRVRDKNAAPPPQDGSDPTELLGL